MKKIIFALILLPFLLHSQDTDVLRFSMKTRWSDEVSPENIWDVYPRPQMKRENWQNLNGKWEYAVLPISVNKPEKFQGEILVPFAIESELSGVKKIVGPEQNLWYQTSFRISNYQDGDIIHLNFGAVDWKAEIFVNNQKAGEHKGGFTPFSIDITPFLEKDEQTLTVKVWDPTDKGTQPRGKQVSDPKGIWYTPVTGIWQTVWIEKTKADYIKNLKNTPDIDQSTIHSEIVFGKLNADRQIKVVAFNKGQEIGSKIIMTKKGQEKATVSLHIPEQMLWTPENPHLYDLSVEIMDGTTTLDHVESYFGMRKISLGKDENGYTRIMLNNKPFFQFGLLDQGWWPDGLFTAPTKEAMMYDVEMTKKWGFNMLRKHVKIEPASFYYECDKMGMLVWQDMPNGNYLDELRIQAWEEEDAKRDEESSTQFERELKEMMDYFHSFPSIVVWVPFNEGWGQYDTERVTRWTENYDPSRLIDSPSGWADRKVGDMIDVHLYPGPGMELPEENRASVLGEFGGIGWVVEDHIWWDKRNWGYLTYEDQAGFKKRFTELMEDLVSLRSFGLSAAIYTQTTDVEGEVNGLMTYDREVIKINPQETQKLISPLYKKSQEYETIISDSEIESNTWLVNFSKPSPDKKKQPATAIDGIWKKEKAPFSSYDNYFLPEGSLWATNKQLNLKKEFNLSSIPDKIILRYYLDKSAMNVYLNGNLIASEKHEGGRKRHYRNMLVADASKHLKTGKNVISIQVTAAKDDHSFDIGLYTTSMKDEYEVFPAESGN